MTPAARLQAAIELLDSIIAAAIGQGPAADTLIARYFKERRYAGAKDRRAVRDHVYAAIRAFAQPPATGRSAMVALVQREPALAALFDGSAHAPAPIMPGEEVARADAEAIPTWLAPALAALVDGDERRALLDRAPLHLRVNALKTSRDALVARLPDATPITNCPHGIMLPEGTSLEALPAWQDGLIDVQDAGSQIIAAACTARPGDTVLDLCAGAGGKTLALAADMAGCGRLIAATLAATASPASSPVRRRPAPASSRPGFWTADGKPKDWPLSGAPATACSSTAPCTGMGTWRRNPESRWRLTPDAIRRSTAAQHRVLTLAEPLVKPGGTLVYAVCSLLDPEGRDQIAAFLAANAAWTAEKSDWPGREWGSGQLLTPKSDASDGFFFARLRKAC